MEHLLTCPVCYEPFDSDPSLYSAEEGRRTSRLPVFSHQCPHKICASCLNNTQIAAMSDQTERAATKNPPKWFKCPCCAQKTAFNAADMKVDLYACEWIRRLKRRPDLFNATSGSPGEENATDFHVPAESFLDMGSSRRACYFFQEGRKISVDMPGVSNPASEGMKNDAGQRKAIVASALQQGKSIEELQAVICQIMDAASTERFLADGAARRYQQCARIDASRRRNENTIAITCSGVPQSSRKRQSGCDLQEKSNIRDAEPSKKKSRRFCHVPECVKYSQGRRANGMCRSHFLEWQSSAKSESISCPSSTANSVAQCKETERVRGVDEVKKTAHELSILAVGSRVEIYWRLDKTYYPATIIAKDGRSENTFTITYDDGVTESIDLGTEMFNFLSNNNTAAPMTESIDSWTCTCGVVNPARMKRCPMPCMKWKVGFFAQKTHIDEPSLSEITLQNNVRNQKKANVTVGIDPGNRPTRGSEKQSMLSKVRIGSRVSIYWEPNRMYFPATVVSRDEEDGPYTFTFLYDDGDEETFDLSTDKFKLLDDAPPEAALAAINAACTANL